MEQNSMEIDFSKKATYRGFAELVGLSITRVRQLKQKGLLAKDGTLGEWHYSYLRNLEEWSEKQENDNYGIKQKIRKLELEGDLSELKITGKAQGLGDIPTLEKAISEIKKAYRESSEKAKVIIFNNIKKAFKNNPNFDDERVKELINSSLDEHMETLEIANIRDFVQAS